MFDVHCHIVYGVDDGAQTFEESLDMLDEAYKSGVKGIVATPHTNVPGSYMNYWNGEILEKIKRIRSAVKEKELDIKIFCGQEIFCTHETVKLLKSGDAITLNNSKYPLIEFDFYEYSDNVYMMLEQIVAEGYIPVVAHPERYRFVMEDKTAVDKLKNIGCLIQVNKGSISGSFGTDAMYAARRILDSRLADVIASDAHSPYIRNTNMLHIHEILCEDYSFDYATLLMSLNPSLILRDKETVSY